MTHLHRQADAGAPVRRSPATAEAATREAGHHGEARPAPRRKTTQAGDTPRPASDGAARDSGWPARRPIEGCEAHPESPPPTAEPVAGEPTPTAGRVAPARPASPSAAAAADPLAGAGLRTGRLC